MSEDLLVGLIALALRAVIGWRIWRGRAETGSFRSTGRGSTAARQARRSSMFLLGLHGLVMLLLAVVAVDLLFGLGLKEKLLGS